jgi:hypothetical protein
MKSPGAISLTPDPCQGCVQKKLMSSWNRARFFAAGFSKPLSSVNSISLVLKTTFEKWNSSLFGWQISLDCPHRNRLFLRRRNHPVSRSRSGLPTKSRLKDSPAMKPLAFCTHPCRLSIRAKATGLTLQAQNTELIAKPAEMAASAKLSPDTRLAKSWRSRLSMLRHW